MTTEQNRREHRPSRRLSCVVGLLALGAAVTAAAAGDKARSSPATARPQAAQVGRQAPDFTLKNLKGDPVALSDFRGKIVVLEWFNPECPFVNLAHKRPLSLQGKADQYKDKGVVWLAVNSNGPGKQGHGRDANRTGKATLAIPYPILLDPTGAVGKSYGATRTPEIFVIDKNGVLVYRGAVDNTRGGDPSDAEPGPARNYVDQALGAALRNEPPEIRQTTPWGCTVKYAD